MFSFKENRTCAGMVHITHNVYEVKETIMMVIW